MFCYAEADKSSSELYNAIHFAENGNDLVVELDKIKHLLEAGANPNWINTEHVRRESVLSRYVSLVGYKVDTPNVSHQVIIVSLSAVMFYLV